MAEWVKVYKPTKIIRKTDKKIFNMQAGESYAPWTYDVYEGEGNLPEKQATESLSTITADTTQMKAPPLFEPTEKLDNALGLQNQLAQQRKTLETAYQNDLERTRQEMEEAKTKEEEWRQKTESTMAEVEPLTSPFRERIERSERGRLQVEENYQKNQALTDELDGLLTETNELTRKLESQKVPGLAGLQQSERMVNAKNNVQGRVAVIQAVMSARNNQIGTALNFIDRTKNSIQEDRQDRLNYLNSLLNWYETQRTEEGAKITELTKDEKEAIKKQTALLESDLAETMAVSNKIKEMMLEDPQLMADSGISLTDDMNTITTKLSDAKYAREVIDQRNELEGKGYKQITAEEATNKPSYEVIAQTDSKGKERHYWKPAPPKEYAPPEAYKIWQLGGGEKGTGMGFGDWYSQIYKGEKGKLPTTSPDWFRKQAEEAFQQSFAPEKVQDLWDEYKKQKEAPEFTDQELKKLEQAGLMEASRQEQLDYLYGEEGGIDFDKIPS